MTTTSRHDGAASQASPRGTGRRRGRGRVAFVLSGGGNLGALQVGMLRALLEHGVVPDLVLGCSVGAINGAGFADDPTLGGVEHMERVWKALDGQNLLPSGWLPNAVALARKGEAIHEQAGLRAMAEESLGSATFEDLRLEFQCVATDILRVREVWFSSGPVVDAILASSALPAVYPAVEIDGVRYLDGGIVDDVPMTRAVELGATTIYVLQVGGFTRPRPEPRRPLDVAVQAYWIARHYRFKRDLLAMPAGVEVHVLPAGETPRMRFNDFTQTGTLIDLAYAASSAYLDDRAAGLPIPSMEDVLSAVEPTYDPEAPSSPPPAGEAEGGDGRWRLPVAVARRRNGDHGRPEPSEPSEPSESSDEALSGATVLTAREDGAGRRPALDASRWRRAVGIARRERPAAGDAVDETAATSGATSGLATAQAVGARVARILSRGDTE